MANPSKRKGTDWESAVKRFLTLSGLPAYRTGSADVGAGDLHYGAGGSWTAECKAEARIDLPGYLKQLGAAISRSGRDDRKAAVWIKNRRHGVPDAYVVMSAECYRSLAVYVEKLERNL